MVQNFQKLKKHQITLMFVVVLNLRTQIERNVWKNYATAVCGKNTAEGIGLTTKKCDKDIVKTAIISYNTKYLITSDFLGMIRVQFVELSLTDIHVTI